LIFVIFGIQNPEETSHQTIINVSTSPVKCIANIPCEKQTTVIRQKLVPIRVDKTIT